MPIVFQQAQPLDVNLAANYGAQRAGGGGNSGAMQQEAADNAAQRQLQATLAGERVAADSGQQRADREWRSEEASRNRGLDRELTATRANAEVLQINERANAQANLQQAELSQAEKVHYQRLRQAVSTIDTDENLSAEDKAVMKTQIQTGINAYAVRDAHATAKMKQMQLQDLHEQRAAAIALETMDQAQRAQHYEKRVVMRKNPYTGQMVPGALDQHGVWKPEFEEPKAATAKPPQPFNWGKEWSEAMKEAEAGYPKLKDESPEREAERMSYAQRVIARRQAEFAAGRPEGQFGIPNSAPVSGGEQKLGIPNSQPAAAFDLAKPEAMTAPQKETHKQYVETAKAIDQMVLPEFEKGPLRAASRQMAELIGRAGGDPKNFTPDQQKQYEELFASMTNMATAAKERSEQNLRNRMRPGDLGGAGKPVQTMGGAAEVVGNLGGFGSREALQKASDERAKVAAANRAEIAKRDADILARARDKDEALKAAGITKPKK